MEDVESKLQQDQEETSDYPLYDSLTKIPSPPPPLPPPPPLNPPPNSLGYTHAVKNLLSQRTSSSSSTSSPQITGALLENSPQGQDFSRRMSRVSINTNSRVELKSVAEDKEDETPRENREDNVFYTSN